MPRGRLILLSLTLNLSKTARDNSLVQHGQYERREAIDGTLHIIYIGTALGRKKQINYSNSTYTLIDEVLSFEHMTIINNIEIFIFLMVMAVSVYFKCSS